MNRDRFTLFYFIRFKLFNFLLLIFLGLFFSKASIAGIGMIMNPRVLGMGGAGTAMRNGIDMAELNPASLAVIDNHRELTASHESITQNRSLNHIGAAMHIRPGGTLGFFYTSDSEKGLENRGDDGALIGLNDYNSTRTSLAYALHINKRLDMGIKLDWIDHEFMDYSASGNTFTLGFNAKITERLYLGLSLIDFEGVLKWSGTSVFDRESLDSTMKFGMTYKKWSSIWNMDFSKTQSSVWNCNFGLEKNISNNLFIRLGWANDHLTTGFGLKVKNYVIDYGYAMQELESRSLLSMKFKFYRLDLFRELEMLTPKGKKKKNEIEYVRILDEKKIRELKLKELEKDYRQKLISGDYDNAFNTLNSISKLDSSSIWLLERADLFAKWGKPEEAAIYCREIIETSDDAQVISNANKLRAQLNKKYFFDSARKISNTYPDFPDKQLSSKSLGDISFSENKFASALVYYKEALSETLAQADKTGKRSPSESMILLNMAQCELKIGEFRKALKRIELLSQTAEDPQILVLCQSLIKELQAQ